MYRLENWSVTRGPYDPPESGGSVSGNVFGNPKFDDGEKITTSTLTDADEDTRVVTTRSGSEYKLVGSPDPEYVKWLEENGHDPFETFPYFKKK